MSVLAFLAITFTLTNNTAEQVAVIVELVGLVAVDGAVAVVVGSDLRVGHAVGVRVHPQLGRVDEAESAFGQAIRLVNSPGASGLAWTGASLSSRRSMSLRKLVSLLPSSGTVVLGAMITLASITGSLEASTASSIVTRRMVRRAGSMVVDQSWPGFISPSPL